MQFLETIASLNGEVLHLKYHQQRVDNTLGVSSFLLSEILNPPQEGYFRCRIIYDKNRATISYHPYTLTLPQSFKIVYADTLDYHFKYEDRKNLNHLKTQYQQYDEVIIVKNSLITDTTIANLAFLDNGQWLTPKTPLLEGTTRARLLEEGFLHVSNITLDDLDKYQGFALMNAMIDFQVIQNGIMAIKK